MAMAALGYHMPMHYLPQPAALPSYFSYYQGFNNFDVSQINAYTGYGYNNYNSNSGNTNGNQNNGGYTAGTFGGRTFRQPGSSNQNNQNNSTSDSLQDAREEYDDKWEEVREEQKKTAKMDMQRLILLTIPFFFFSRPTATYFAATELLSVYLDKLGASELWNLIIMLAVQGLDMVALSRGQIKFVQGGVANMQQELYDTAVGVLGANDLVRLGSQMFLSQGPAPTYIS